MTAPTRTRWSETPSPVHPHVYGDRRECYPADMLAKRRAEFLARIAVHNAAAAVGVPAEIATDGELASPLEARLAAIDNALGEVYDRETVNNLLEEKAEILASLDGG
jgi:hypothetical protein